MIWVLAKFIAISAVITALIPLVLIASQRPVADLRAPEGAGLRFDLVRRATVTDPAPVVMRDGTPLPVRRYPGEAGAPLLVLAHGSGWHGMQFEGLAQALAAKGFAVVVPDLRGHGVAPARRGDVDYIGQMEDDLADLITATRAPGQKVVLGGHSSGGGLVVRFAGGAHRGLIDGAVLLAPFLGHRAPTQRPASGGWAEVLTRRAIGLTMLNTVRIHALDHLTVVQFRFPGAVLVGPLGATATRAYSWRLNTSYSPRWDWAGDVAALPSFLLVAGEDDEAFIAQGYQPAMAPLTGQGAYHLLPAVGHLGVVDAPETTALIAGFLGRFR